MKTHTIRNKSTGTPIVTFTPAFRDKLLEAGPDSTALVISWYTARYKELTGKTIALDHSQVQQLQKNAGCDEHGSWTGAFSHLEGALYKLETTFVRGFLATHSGMDLEGALELAHAFYSMLEKTHGKTERKMPETSKQQDEAA